MADRHNLVREGVIAGFIGATALALWFLIVDVVTGEAFRTPRVLGYALFSVLGGATSEDSWMLHVAGYTVFHYLVFILLGILTVKLVHIAEEAPHVLAGVTILFVIIHIGSYGLSTGLAASDFFGGTAWYLVLAGNLIAAIGMGLYVWRSHPKLRQEFDSALGGRGV